MGLPTREICLCFLSQSCPLPLLVRTHSLLLLHTGEAEVEFAVTLFEYPKIDHGIIPNLLNLTQHGQMVVAYRQTHKTNFKKSKEIPAGMGTNQLLPVELFLHLVLKVVKYIIESL